MATYIPTISTYKCQTESDSFLKATVAKKLDLNNRNATFSAKLAEEKILKRKLKLARQC